MRYLLDANICIYFLIGANEGLYRRVTACDAGDLAVSSIAYAEIALGSARGKLPPPKVLDAFLEEVTLVPFDEGAARAYATLPFRRGSFDRLIAAHAFSLGLTLVTGNGADFSDVPGLTVENWAS